YGGRGRTPVFVQLQAACTRGNLLDQARSQAGIALAEDADVDRKRIGGLQHALHVPRARGARRGGRPGRWTGPAAEQRGEAGIERLLDLLRADDADVHVGATGSGNLAFTPDRPTAAADHAVEIRLGVP